MDLLGRSKGEHGNPLYKERLRRPKPRNSTWAKRTLASTVSPKKSPVKKKAKKGERGDRRYHERPHARAKEKHKLSNKTGGRKRYFY